MHRARRPVTTAFAAVALVAVAVLAGCSTAPAAPSSHTAKASASPGGHPASGVWGIAQQVPGLSALNKDREATVTSVSCASAGNCSAGGNYTDNSGKQAFVVSEVDGTWQRAEEAPGTAALNHGGATITSVSCASPGDCSAGGNYTDSAGNQQAFVADEVNGTWQRAEEAPGTAALNKGGAATVTSVSCASAGDCSAGGDYADSAGINRVFVADEVNGTWQRAEEIPGTADHAGSAADVAAVSCPSAGNCVAGGSDVGSGPSGGPLTEAFVVNEKNGTWADAIEVPGTAALSQNETATINSVSCPSAGNCAAGGYYIGSSGPDQAFVVSEVDGTWQQAEEVPGTSALNQAPARSATASGVTGAGAGVSSVSCISAGNCTAGGYYTDSAGRYQAFVVSETDGAWQQAEEVPGTSALNQAPSRSATVSAGGVSSVSCASAGNCTAVGGYTDSSGHDQVFVADEVNGTWQQAEEVPGTAGLNRGGNASITSVSCAPTGSCSAAGSYSETSLLNSAFLVTKP